MRPLLMIPLLAGVLAGTAGCELFEGGPPAESNAPSTLEIGPSAPGSARAKPRPLPLSEVDACALLSTMDRERYQVARTAPVDLGRGRACQYTAEDFILTVGIRARQGLDGFADDYGDAVRNRVGGYPALRVRSDAGDCLTGIGFTANSRIDVDVSTPDGTSRACQLTDDIAERIAARVRPD